jgi:hypothetical protein
MPTIAPTKALTTTSSENCARFSRSPRRTSLTERATSRAVATRQPRARQSATPCSIRWASKPLARSSSTASTAITQ